MTGLELKLKRIEAGLTQYGVAAVLGIPPATLSYYENGHRPLPPGMEDRILRAIERARQEQENACHGEPHAELLCSYGRVLCKVFSGIAGGERRGDGGQEL